MRFFTYFLSAVAFAAASPVPTKNVQTGSLVYGDVSMTLKVGCQAVNQNPPPPDSLPKPGTYFTKLQANYGFVCELHREPDCFGDPFLTVTGPAAKAEYVSGWLLSVDCKAVLSPKAYEIPDVGIEAGPGDGAAQS